MKHSVRSGLEVTRSTRIRLNYQSSLIAVLLIAFALRVYSLNTIPNGLFIDEAARGYDAYSISRTGADAFGDFLPVFPRGFDDYTPALYTYLTVPFVVMLDLSHFSTRLAAALIGLFTVAVAFQAIRRPFGPAAALAGAALLAISPWYIVLNRIGTEWSLLGLGPMLTIVLAYRGLRRSAWLVAAGIAAGFSLYGYAPVKAFLPLLMVIFIVFYWRELIAQKWAGVSALLIFIAFAVPIYSFSFTASGLTRFNEVTYLNNTEWSTIAYSFTSQYLAYFNPKFLFITDLNQPNLFFVQRLKSVGILYLFEMPLIIIGLWQILHLRQRDQFFWLAWLLAAPIGINVLAGTKPALWLTSTPTLHGLAGAGAAYLFKSRLDGFSSDWPLTLDLQRRIAAAALVLLGILAIFNFSRMVDDLFSEYPLYAAHTVDWGYGMKQAAEDMIELGPGFDTANWDTLGVVGAMYLAYYSQILPDSQRLEAIENRRDVWNRIGATTVGPTEALVAQPGCHLSMTDTGKLFALPAPSLTLVRYTLPDGQQSQFQISAVASPHGKIRSVQAIFDHQILLDSFSLASAKPDENPVMAAGQALCVVLNWQSTGSLSTNYTAFVHLTGQINPLTGNPLWAQHDGLPAGGQHPTVAWQPGELIRDMHVLFIPADLPAGTYQLIAGLYDSATGQRLTVNQADHVPLIEISIAP